MCSGAFKGQNENIVLDLVDQKPVILNVTFTKALEIAVKRMILQFLRELFSHFKLFDNRL